MSLPYAKPSWLDGDFTVAKPVGLPVFSSPIPLSTEVYLFNQDFVQFRNNFTPLALGTPHVDYPTYYLVKEGDLKDQLGAVVRWTRTYAQVPASYSLWETFPYNFIGTLIPIGPTTGQTLITRTRQLWTVDSRIQYDYFLVPSEGVTDPITHTTHDLNGPGDIDQIQQMVYCYQNVVPTGSSALYGGITLSTEILNPVGSTLPTWPPSCVTPGSAPNPGSYPTGNGGVDTYEQMVGDALQNEWDATVTKVFLNPTNTLSGTPTPNTGHMAGTVILSPFTSAAVLGGQIPAEPSRLDLWLGSIWVRRTRFVLAK